MSNQQGNKRNEHVFQMESGLVNKLNEHKQKAKQVCGGFLNQHVKVTTVHGEVIEGIIVQIDDKHVYLNPVTTAGRSRSVYPGYSPYGPYGPRPPYGPYGPYSPYGPYGPYPNYPVPYNPYANAIMPLALFDLLAVALLV